MEHRRRIRWSLDAGVSLLGLMLLTVQAGCGGGGGDPAAASATLTWIGAAGTPITGYRVYYGLASGSYLQAKGAGISVGPAETYVVTGLSPGSHYYFAVTAVDASGNESAYSNEASKVID